MSIASNCPNSVIAVMVFLDLTFIVLFIAIIVVWLLLQFIIMFLVLLLSLPLYPHNSLSLEDSPHGGGGGGGHLSWSRLENVPSLLLVKDIQIS